MATRARMKLGRKKNKKKNKKKTQRVKLVEYVC